jgi:hypothetical protein
MTTTFGEIRIEWVREGDGFKVNVKVPSHVVIDWNYEHIPKSMVTITYLR